MWILATFLYLSPDTRQAGYMQILKFVSPHLHQTVERNLITLLPIANHNTVVGRQLIKPSAQKWLDRTAELLVYSHYSRPPAVQLGPSGYQYMLKDLQASPRLKL